MLPRAPCQPPRTMSSCLSNAASEPVSSSPQPCPAQPWPPRPEPSPPAGPRHGLTVARSCPQAGAWYPGLGQPLVPPAALLPGCGDGTGLAARACLALPPLGTPGLPAFRELLTHACPWKIVFNLRKKKNPNDQKSPLPSQPSQT